MKKKLYDGIAPHENTDTSLEAAVRIMPHRDSMRERIFHWFSGRGADGGISDEVEVALGMRHQTASARVRELELLGKLVKTEARRRTSSGRRAQVLVVPEKA
jgi:hypothetical protein